MTSTNPTHLPAAECRRLHHLAHTYDVRVAATFVRKHTWLTRRKVRTVIAATRTFGAKTTAVTTDMLNLAQEIHHHAA